MDCKECQAMRTAAKERLSTRQKCSVLKVLIISLSAVLIAAIISGAYIFDKHLSALEDLLSGACISEEIEVNGGENGVAIFGDSNSAVNGDNNEVDYGLH